MFRKRYASSSRFFEYRHESAYLLAKGKVQLPAEPLPDVMDWQYTGNRLHPTQKPAECLTPVVRSLCRPGGLVLDPFCGSGSSLVAARDAGCAFLGIELDAGHHATASERLNLGCPEMDAVGDDGDVMPWLRPFTRYAAAA